jgi:hypothetical protein
MVSPTDEHVRFVEQVVDTQVRLSEVRRGDCQIHLSAGELLVEHSRI